MKTIFLFFALLVTATGFSQTAERYARDADSLLEAGKLSQANALVEKGLALGNSAHLLTTKGDILVKMKKFQEAYNAYSQAMAADGAFVPAYNARGLLLSSVRQNDDAIADFTAALTLPRLSDTMRHILLINRAASRYSKRAFQEAYEDLMMVYREDSSNIGVLNNLATISDEVGKGDQTIRLLERVVQLDSTFLGGYGNLGFKYQLMGDYNRSNAYFEKALRLDPNSGITYSNMAYNSLKLGDLKTAHRYADKAIKLYPANSYAYRNRALIFLAENNRLKACDDIREGLRLGFTESYGPELQQLLEERCLKN